MKDMKEINTIKFRQNLLIVAIGIVLFVALMNLKTVWGAVTIVLGLFTPLVFGGVIAFILNVPMSFFEKNFERLNEKHPTKFLSKGKRVISYFIVLILFLLVISFVLSVLAPNMRDAFKSIHITLMESIPGWLAWFDAKGFDMDQIYGFLDKINYDSIADFIKADGGYIIGIAKNSLGGVFGVVGNIGIGFIFSIYILFSKEKLGRQARMITYSYLKKEWADKICGVASLTYRTFAKFLSGQCLEAAILGALFFVVLFVARFPYAGAISLVIGTMALIPIIGAFIGFFFGALLLLTVSLRHVVIFIIIFVVLQQIEGHLIYPKVVGGSVGLPALWTLLAVIVGGKVNGIFGIIVFIPLFSVLYTLLKQNVSKRLASKGEKIR